MSTPLIECVVSRFSLSAKKNLTEKYLIDALSFTEAEIRLGEQMQVMASNEYDAAVLEEDPNPNREKPKAKFDIKSLKSISIADVLTGEEGEYFFEFKVGYEPDGKGSKFTMLVKADDLEGALRQVKEHNQGMVTRCYISKIGLVSVLDLFKYSGPIRENDPSKQLPLDFNNRQSVLNKVETLLDKIDESREAEKVEALKKGDMVEVIDGPHYGSKGIFIKKHLNKQSLISLIKPGSPEVYVYNADLKVLATAERLEEAQRAS